MKFKFIALAVAAAFSVSASAADVTLTGDYLKLGVSNSGSLIDFSTSTGIQFDATGTGSFSSGKDILTPGTPFAFYSIGANGSYDTAGGYSASSNPFGVTTFNLAGTGTYSYSFGGVTSAGLSFSQTLVFDPKTSHFSVSVTLTNSTKVAVNNVSFATGFDPDQDVGYGGSYSTQNTVLGTGANAAVSAYGTASNTLITLSNITNSNTVGGTDHVFASVSAPWDTNPTNLFSAPNDGNGDNTISLAYDLGTLAAGQAKSFAYDVAITAVPEPESYAMLLAGLGLMGTIARRRNKAAKA